MPASWQRSVRLAIPYVISVLILSAALAGAVVMVIRRPAPATRTDEARIPLVGVHHVQPFQGKLGMDIRGMVVPFREIRVSAEVSGRISEKYPAARAGQYVTRGSPLLVIDPSDYKLEIARLEAEVQQADGMIRELDNDMSGAEASLRLAEQDFELAQREFDRVRQLRTASYQAELDQSQRNLLTSQRSVTEAENALSSLQTRRDRLVAGKTLAEASLQRSRLNLQRTQIVAPADGVVVRDLVEEGDFVSVGTQLLIFEDTSRAEVRTSLRPDQLAWLLKNYPGAPQHSATRGAAYSVPQVDVSLAAQTAGVTAHWTGVLQRIEGIGLDDQTRTVPIRIWVQDPVTMTPLGPRALVRGMYVWARIEIDVGPSSPRPRYLTMIPAAGLQPGNVVWMVENDRLVRRELDIVGYHRENSHTISFDEAAEWIIVADDENGVRAGSKIVVTPLSQPSEGALVRILDPASGLAQQDTLATPERPLRDDQFQPAATPAWSPTTADYGDSADPLGDGDHRDFDPRGSSEIPWRPAGSPPDGVRPDAFEFQPQPPQPEMSRPTSMPTSASKENPPS